MKINISNWLISQVQLYPPNSPAVLGLNTSANAGVYLTVSLYLLTTNDPCGNIKIAWVFGGSTSTSISVTKITDLYRMDSGATFYSPNITIPMNYTWGQVLLIECISISGAS